MAKTAILIGSTGLTGSHLMRILLNSDIYDKTICFVRRETKISHPKLVQHIVDFDDVESYKDYMEGHKDLGLGKKYVS